MKVVKKLLLIAFIATTALTSCITPSQVNYLQDIGDYLVDVNGNIQFPIIGEIHVAGLTRLDLQDTIKNRLLQGCVSS